jgi:uncharacterized protein (TIGR02246 family)
MTRSFIVFLVLCFSLAIPGSVLSKPDIPADDHQAVKQCVEHIASAWNQEDIETLANFFSQNGVLVTPTGSTVRTREGIKKRILKEREGRLAGTSLRNIVERITFVDRDTAVVRGKYHLDGMSLLMGLKSSAQGSFVLRQKKQANKWMISRAQINK